MVVKPINNNNNRYGTEIINNSKSNKIIARKQMYIKTVLQKALFKLTSFLNLSLLI